MQLLKHLIIISHALMLLKAYSVYGNNPPGVENDNQFESHTYATEGESQREVFANYIINPKLSHCYSLNNEDSFCYYYIEDEHRTILTHSNRIEYIKFDNDILLFDYSDGVPNTLNWSFISICTHKQNIPLLIQIISSKRAYFYSPDPETGKWSTHIIDKLSKYKEVDENGVTSYKFDLNKHSNQEIKIFYDNISEECAEISKTLSNDIHGLIKKVIDFPIIEINIELTELLHTSAPLAEDEHFTRPKLELSSFKGEGDIRIQTYSLEVESPVARAILVHGYRNHFPSEFLNYNPKYFRNIGSEFQKYPDLLTDAIRRNVELKYKYGEDLVSTEELKSMVDGQLKLEDCTVDVYKDGTDGWVTTDRYVYEESFAQLLNLNGISIHGLDLRSFGASEAPRIFGVDRARGLIDDFDNLAKDLITFTKIIKEKYNDGLPLYLIGISMGGTVATRAIEIHEKEKLVNGTILIAPGMKICGDKLLTIYKRGKWLMSIVALLKPKHYVESGKRKMKTNYNAVLKTDDPYCPNTDAFFRTGFNLFKGCCNSIDNAGKIDPELPFLIIHSTTDDVSFFEGTEKFYNSLTQVKKKNFIRLYNLDHHATTALKYYLPLAEFISYWIKDETTDYKLDYTFP